MSNHTCSAVVISCIDFRFQNYINTWIQQNIGQDNFDRVALAGGVKDFDAILKQLEISKKLHHINKVVLLNHEDCGAYGPELAADKQEEHLEHENNLKDAVNKTKQKFNDLDVKAYFLHLDGTFELIA